MGAKFSGYWDRCAERGIEANPYRSGFLQLVAVAETDAAAERDYYPHADYFYNKCLHVFEGFCRCAWLSRSRRYELALPRK